MGCVLIKNQNRFLIKMTSDESEIKIGEIEFPDGSCAVHFDCQYALEPDHNHDMAAQIANKMKVHRWIIFCGNYDSYDWWCIRHNTSQSIYLFDPVKFNEFVQKLKKRSKLLINHHEVPLCGIMFVNLTFSQARLIQEFYQNARYFKCSVLTCSDCQLSPVTRSQIDVLCLPPSRHIPRLKQVYDITDSININLPNNALLAYHFGCETSPAEFTNWNPNLEARVQLVAAEISKPLSESELLAIRRRDLERVVPICTIHYEA